MYKAVLFDLDGTLLDTSEGILKSINETLRDYNLPELSEDLKRSFIGPPINRSIKQTYGFTDEKTTEISNHFRDIYKNKYLMEATPYEGIYKLFQALKEANVKRAVATYKRDDYAKMVMKKYDITSYCDYVQGADFENKLTKKDIVQNCIHILKVYPQDTVLIGDTMNDYEAAISTGIDFIAVTYGFGQFSEDALKKSVLVADDVQSILDYFTGLME